MELHLNIIGYALIPLALVHAIFPKYFNWKEELKSLSLMNRQMMTVHTFFIALTVLLVGVLCVVSAQEIVSTKLGNHIAFGLAVFWSIRLFTQFFWYSSKLWKGKTFETIVHILFSLFWIYMTVVFWWVWRG
jgi:hypothetical protein